ncbi:hypothetical protein [Nocardiopsis composta]|uniref:Uncharacterized protein n=1 Tax=Nocardiopsis composta TaxID=157465 RepID=A0A7W8VEN2_9ACTN|nr:hypothetical protein [Nocardiopsis composta]MBB5433270.1 hypothetical protein [Nocardiopsis composta]
MEPDIDARLHDREALEEIELYADVLIAVAGVEHALSTAELDRVLGVSRHERRERHEGPGPHGARPLRRTARGRRRR